MFQIINRCFLYFTIPIILGGLGSCKKSFLDVDNTTNLNRQAYVKDLNSMESFKNGIYVMINNDFEKGVTAAYPDVVADNLKPLNPPSQQLLLSHYLWDQQASDVQETTSDITSVAMNGIWKTGYQIIRACSFVVEDIDKYSSENQDLANDIKGQALALRAMVHFKLVNIFAQGYKFTDDASHQGIPYITTSNIGSSFSRQTVEEDYNGMITDLTSAIDLLPEGFTDTRYMNQAAAKAMLARIYLFKEDYSNAKDIATDVCNRFPLLTIANGYPNDLFKNKNPNQSEVLYRLTPVNNSANVSSFLGVRLRGSLLRFTATNEIANIYKENLTDVRSNWVTNAAGLWNVTKFPVSSTPELPEITRAETAYYPPYIRSSEMFLTVAEAAVKTGDENTARSYLDAIRKRANPTIASITATGNELIDSIYKERRKELAFEGLRMFDLQRWKLGVHRGDVIAGAPKDLPYGDDKAISPIHLLDVNLAGLDQNAGY